MERLINSDSTVTQLWNPITLRNPEDEGVMSSGTSVQITGTGRKAPQGNYRRYHCESTPEDSVLQPYKDYIKV
jgi:hypothetical protein